MESFYKQTTVACAMFPAASAQKADLFEPLLNLHYQIVLRVAEDANLIEESWRLTFYKYLANCVRICGGSVDTIGGAPDSVHLLIALPSSKALAQFLRELKLLSQTWVRRKMQIPNFAWRGGSEAFTVSPTQRERVKTYIQRQNQQYRRGAKKD